MNFIRRYPILSFFMLALAFGTGTIYLVIQDLIPASLALSSVLSASVAGVIMTAVLDGRCGLKLMFDRLLTWRVGIGYWLFALFFLVPTFLFGSAFNPLFGGEPIALSGLKPGFNILLVFIVFFLTAGLGQELGWSGFLTPRLQARYGAFTSSLIRTLLVAIWHIPLVIYLWLHPHAIPDFPYGVWIAQKGFLSGFSAMLTFMLVWNILYTWMFNNTGGSLLLVSVLHGSEIWLAYWMMRTGISPHNLDNYWGYGLVMVLVAAVLVIVTGPRNLSRKYKRIVDPN